MNNDNPISISIIIPVYNVSKYIERCIESVLNQTYSNVECILIDDCSQDDSMDIVNKKLQNYNGTKRILIIHHKKNSGLSAARNTGIRNATGDYVYLLDSDDEITPNCIELLADKINNKEEQVDFVISDYEIIDNVNSNSKERETLSLSEGYYYGNNKIFDYYLSGNLYAMAWNKLVRKSFIEIHNLWFKEGYINEDELWSFMLANKAKSICVVSQKTYMYYYRKGSIMRSLSYQKRVDSSIKITQLVLEYVNQNNLYDNLKVRENIESRNRYIFVYSFFSNYKTKECYNNLRNGLHCNPLLFIFKDFKYFISTFHFLLPKRLGYIFLSQCIRIKYKKVSTL